MPTVGEAVGKLEHITPMAVFPGETFQEAKFENSGNLRKQIDKIYLLID